MIHNRDQVHLAPFPEPLDGELIVSVDYAVQQRWSLPQLYGVVTQRDRKREANYDYPP